MESELVIGGDQPFVGRLIGVSISPMVGSIYNMGVWDKVAAARVKAGFHRTLEGEAVGQGGGGWGRSGRGGGGGGGEAVEGWGGGGELVQANPPQTPPKK